MVLPKVCLLLHLFFGVVAGGMKLQENQSISNKICAEKIINNIFYDSEATTILTDDSELCDSVWGSTIPKTVLNMKKSISSRYHINNTDHVIMCVNDMDMHTEQVQQLVRLRFRAHRKGFGNLRLLIIISAYLKQEINQLFQRLWGFGVSNVFIYVYEEEILYTGNRFEVGNECGKLATVIHNHSCHDEMQIKYTNIPINLNGCPITLKNIQNETGVLDENESQSFNTVYKRNFLELLTYYFNGKISGKSQDSADENNASTPPSIPVKFNNVKLTLMSVHQYSSGIYTQDIYWMVPRANVIPPMEVILVTFEKTVWILIGFTFIIATIAWWVILSCKKRSWTVGNMADAMTIVTSLTILASVATVPKSNILRCILMTYIIYVIHISCGFTSNLINILTQAQYEFQISNLKQLAESNLPIYIPHKFIREQFNLNDTGCRLYTKLKNMTVPVINLNQYVDAFINLHDYRNCAVIILEDDFPIIKRMNPFKHNAYGFSDNTIFGQVIMRLEYFPNHYSSVYIERFIAAFTESGIRNKISNDLKETYLKMPRPVDEENVPLNLGHLCFTFALLGFGLALSMTVFFIELGMSWYQNKQVVI